MLLPKMAGRETSARSEDAEITMEINGNIRAITESFARIPSLTALCENSFEPEWKKSISIHFPNFHGKASSFN
jgi:hypothetical protein